MRKEGRKLWFFMSSIRAISWVYIAKTQWWLWCLLRQERDWWWYRKGKNRGNIWHFAYDIINWELTILNYLNYNPYVFGYITRAFTLGDFWLSKGTSSVNKGTVQSAQVEWLLPGQNLNIGCLLCLTPHFLGPPFYSSHRPNDWLHEGFETFCIDLLGQHLALGFMPSIFHSFPGNSHHSKEYTLWNLFYSHLWN